MKYSILTTLFLVGIITISGCGGGSSDKTTTNSNQHKKNDNQNNSTPNDTESGKTINNQTTNPQTDVSPVNFQPVTQNITCDPTPYTVQNITIDNKYAAEGDIVAKCINIANMSVVEYALKEGVDTLEIQQLIKKEYNYGTTSLGSGYELHEYDYKAGTIHHVEHYTSTVGTFENQNREATLQDIDCVETYTSILPTTISSTSEIEELLDWEGNGAFDRISTTCPDSYYATDKTEEDLSQYTNLTGTFTQKVNYTLTDTTDKTHLLYTEIQINAK